jgi:diguanylate cyclase (GGDEF)-like protein
MRNLSTRARIVLLVVASALPAIGLVIYETFEERAVEEARIRTDLVRVATMAAQHHGQIVEGARRTLVAMAQALPALRHDRQACNQYLAHLRKESGGLYHSMGLFAADGELLCNAMPWQGKLNSGDRLYVRRTLASGKFSAGEYQFGRVTRRHGINFGYPLFAAGGAVEGVAFVALDLESFEHVAGAAPLPALGALDVIDEAGTLLARHPTGRGVIGQKLLPARVREAALSAPSAVFEADGVDGARRVFAYQAVLTNADGSIPLRAMASMPLSAVYDEINRGLWRQLAGLFIGATLLFVVAWYGSERLVLRSIRRLVETAKRLHAGDLGARTRFRPSRDELSEVGVVFDEMAQALQEREDALRQAVQALREQSITDPLTGLYNRRYLLELLPRELMRAQRSGGALALIMVDLDHFKRINDGFGHEAGDLVLKRLGGLLKQSVRGSDTACRYGGEEFLLVLPEAAAEGAAGRAEAIRRAVKSLALSHLERPLGTITASLGVAVFPDDAADAETLLRAADEALYRAKNSGRDQVCAARALLEASV